MAKPFPQDTYLVNIDETETVYKDAAEEGIVNARETGGGKEWTK